MLDRSTEFFLWKTGGNERRIGENGHSGWKTEKCWISARKLENLEKMGTNPGSSNGDIEHAEVECCIIRTDVFMLCIFTIVFISCKRSLRPYMRIQNTCVFIIIIDSAL